MIEKIMSRIGYSKVEKSVVGPLSGDVTLFKSLRELLSSSATAQITQPYKQSVWVHACISKIIENMMRVPFILKKDAGDLEPGVINSGPLYELFQNPNPLMNQEELIRSTMGYYCLRGEAFWIMEGRDDVTKIPREIWTFDPVRFESVHDKNTGWLLGWKYKGKTEVTFSVNEIIQFKTFNPYDDVRGLAPYEAAKLSSDQNYQASVYNKAFFENGATVGGFISVPDELTDEAYNRLVKQFEDRHKGASKAHKIAVVEGGGKYTAAKLSHKEMDFNEGKKLTKDEILAVYSVNEVVLGDYVNTKSFEGIKAAHKAFWEECLMPKILYFENTLWSRFFSNIGQRRGKGRVWGQFDLANVGPLQQNYAEKIATAKDMFHMGWPINDINKRLELGMREVPWGNQWWVPGGFLPVTALENAKPTPKKPNEEEPESSEEDDSDKNEDQKNVAIAKFYCDPIEDEFLNKFKKFLFEVRKRAIAASFEQKDWDSVVLGKDVLKLQSSLSAVYLTGVNAGIASVQAELGPFEVSYNTHEVNKFRDSRASFIANSFKALLGGIIVNLSAEQVNGDKVREVFNFLSTKSTTIVKGETEASFAYGRNIALQKTKNILGSLLTDKFIEDSIVSNKDQKSEIRTSLLE
jgi:HK97 family phage portal protein